MPGYAEAAAAGLLPRVPEHPPALSVQPTARSLMHRFIALALGGSLVLGVVAGVVDRSALHGPATAGVLGALALVFLVVLLLALPRVGRQSVAELQQGYTTLTLQFGGFWCGEGPLTLSGEMRAAWDYRGTWQLDHRDGRVLRAPDRGVDPPGMYPSPNQPGRMELWTGRVWLEHVADRP
ncbi:hypothetical protein GCM10010972_19090 [Cellulomonas carbonis]|uniref:Uncharacterized protein n=1 Tax=Cellulomonas carbonis T26 TaxID=947969 RepID=A0A0A0BZW7_9CELL|nr:hypothetical protein N868_07080 [Cellulomonas carbonis T26]GGC06059.1 hypothetical protein GCM10010972_19090 [Cellulomonas carbonis]